MQAWLRAGAGALPPCPVPEALRALFTREAAALAVGILLVLAAVRALAWTARFVWVYWLRAGVDPLSFGGKGSWAVVTGASEGIGRAYAGLLAERGINIVLVALPEPRLHEAAAELGVQYGVQTRVMPLDLATAHDDPHAFAATVGAALAGIEVGILINNAGLYQEPAYLFELSNARIHTMVAVNSFVPTLLCKMVLPGMKARGRGLIVSTGSAVANCMKQAPLLAPYGASKAYLDSLTRALDAECAPCGVRVQNLWPAFVATRMTVSGTTKVTTSLIAPSPDTWARSALRQFGHATAVSPYWVHALLELGFQLMPTLSHRNSRRLADEGRQRALAAAAAAAEAAGAAAGKGGKRGKRGAVQLRARC